MLYFLLPQPFQSYDVYTIKNGTAEGGSPMKKEQAISIIKEAAKRHGFVTCKYTMTRLVEIQEPDDTHYLTFFIQERTSSTTDWSRRKITMELHFRASLASMGGEPTPEELIRASDIIRRGAELVQELEGMGLSYTEEF